EKLPQVCDELRQYIIDVVAVHGGHFGASLGVVELTVAAHYVFETPFDQLVWDVGHQAYGHKILTGRRDAFPTNRKYGGLSGFPKRSESEFDTFGVAHASTSISAALGMAKARDLKGTGEKVVAVIGDGAMTGGLAFEGLNNAGTAPGSRPARPGRSCARTPGCSARGWRASAPARSRRSPPASGTASRPRSRRGCSSRPSASATSGPWTGTTWRASSSASGTSRT